MSLKDTVATISTLLTIKNSDIEKNYTIFDVPIYFNSKKYSPRAFTINDVYQTTSNNPASVSLDIDNTDKEFYNLLSTTDLRGAKVELIFVALDDNLSVIDFYYMYSGFVDNFTITDKTVTLDTSDELIFMNKSTFRKHTYDLFPNIKDVEEKPLIWGAKKL